MQADYSVELGREDPALELPWRSDDGTRQYLDLKHHPELIAQVEEAANSPELRAFLLRVNDQRFSLQTAKCDTWYSEEISPEEEIFGAAGKFISYVDLVFATAPARLLLEEHESLAKRLCALLQRAPEVAAAIELIIRRCYYHPDGNADESDSGFCITAYVSGFGEDEAEARQRWRIALTLFQHALVQVAR